MKRILVMGMSKDRGGMETFIMNYYRHIDHSRFQFDFISYNQEPYCAREIESLGGRCFVITGRFTDYRKNKKELRDFFAAHGSEYAALWYNCCLVSDLTILKLAVKYNIPRRIVHAHNSQAMGSKLTNTLHSIYKGRLPKYATDFWACAEEAGAFFYKDTIMQSESFRVITNAIDVRNFSFRQEARDRIRQEEALGDHTLVLGNVARLDPEKNHSFLLDIFAAIHNERPDSLLWIVGQGRLELELKAKARELGLEDSVHFLGERKDVPDLLCAMDAFLLPSRFEGLPMTLIEAQASGLPSFTPREAVPVRAGATNLLTFLSLQDSPLKWSETILARLSPENAGPRENAGRDLLKTEWNITQAAAKLEELF